MNTFYEKDLKYKINGSGIVFWQYPKPSFPPDFCYCVQYIHVETRSGNRFWFFWSFANFMVYIFEFFKFSTLLTWIFETISSIISNGIGNFMYVWRCVLDRQWQVRDTSFLSFHTLLELLYVVVIYRPSAVVKRAWPPWSQHLQNHYVVSMPHNETIRWFWMAFAQCEWITDSSNHYSEARKVET